MSTRITRSQAIWVTIFLTFATTDFFQTLYAVGSGQAEEVNPFSASLSASSSLIIMLLVGYLACAVIMLAPIVLARWLKPWQLTATWTACILILVLKILVVGSNFYQLYLMLHGS